MLLSEMAALNVYGSQNSRFLAIQRCLEFYLIWGLKIRSYRISKHANEHVYINIVEIGFGMRLGSVRKKYVSNTTSYERHPALPVYRS